jgi:hypothetical protein
LIQKLRTFMARNGIPQILYADKGSAYESLEFRSFCKRWGIKLIMCSGKYPQGNGTAEAAVKRVTNWLKSATNEDKITKAIIAWHQTPTSMGRPTPAELHLGRNVRDEITTCVEQCKLDWSDVRAWKLAQKESNALQYNKHAKTLPELRIGDPVFVSMHGKWRRAVIEQEALRPRSFRVKLSDTGMRVERNRVHLRLDKTKSNKETDMSLFFFSAGQETEKNKHSLMSPGPSPASQRTTQDRSLEVVRPSLPPEEPEFPSPSSAEERPPTTTKTKKLRTDREAEYLKRQQQTRVGRETQIVKKFDPSDY